MRSPTVANAVVLQRLVFIARQCVPHVRIGLPVGQTGANALVKQLIRCVALPGDRQAVLCQQRPVPRQLAQKSERVQKALGVVALAQLQPGRRLVKLAVCKIEQRRQRGTFIAIRIQRVNALESRVESQPFAELPTASHAERSLCLLATERITYPVFGKHARVV